MFYTTNNVQKYNVFLKNTKKSLFLYQNKINNQYELEFE